MNIWLVKIGEPVPLDAFCKERVHRTGLLSHYLAESGHDVTWWTSTFDRIRRETVSDSDRTVFLNQGLRVILLHGGGYRKSISLARMAYHRRVARKFKQRAQGEAPPDLILSAYPTVELCKEAVAYGRLHRIPVVLDMRDMWPDIILDTAPPVVRPFARVLLGPMIRNSRQVCSEATAITGITEEFVDWGLSRGSRARTVLDRSFPMAYVQASPPKDDIEEAAHFWDGLGISGSPSQFVACFIGTMGHQFDLGTAIRAFRIVQESGRRGKLVLCGTGDRLEHYRKMASGDRSILFPGWVNAAMMYVLLRRASVGLNPIPERYDFLSTINNKAIEYMSAGLPILASPQKGVLHDFIATHDLGRSYDPGDATGLARQMIAVMDHPDAWKRFSDHARQAFERYFNAEIVYREMGKYLCSVVEDFRNTESEPLRPCPNGYSTS